MSRSSFALLTLLASLAGPLVFAPVARGEEQPLPTCPAEAYGVQSVCTPPPAAVHPADTYGLVPHPGYADEYADADAEAAWSAETPVADCPAEDWRDFVVETEPSSVSDRYDDLFDTMYDFASKTIHSMRPTVREADVKAYQAESSNAPEYDPYEANADADSDPEYDSIEAYESEFSGYGRTDYLRDNYHYRSQGSRGLFFTRAASGMAQRLMRSDLVTDSLEYGSEVYFDAQQLAAECSLEAIVDASELAWDRLEEYQRLTRRELPLADPEGGYRLAGDDCGWDCWYGMRGAEPAPSPPAAELVTASQRREALRTVAIGLRSLAGQLDAASAWVANLGEIDVAELEVGSAAR